MSSNDLLLLRLIHNVNDKNSTVPKATQPKQVISLKQLIAELNRGKRVSSKTHAAAAPNTSAFLARVKTASSAVKNSTDSMMQANRLQVSCRLYSAIMGSRSRTTMAKVMRRREKSSTRRGE